MKGEQIKKMLANKGIGTTKLAEMLETTPQNVSSLLSGLDVKTGLLERISDLTGIPIAEFYGERFGMVNSGNSDTIIGDNNNATSLVSQAIDEISQQRKVTQQVVEELAEQRKCTQQALNLLAQGIKK